MQKYEIARTPAYIPHHRPWTAADFTPATPSEQIAPDTLAPSADTDRPTT